MRTGPTNVYLKNLIRDLKRQSNKENVQVWGAVARALDVPTRKRRAVNLYKINKYSHDNETVVVPGKVLGVGEITKNISVCAFEFSSLAKSKIKTLVDFYELMKKNPKGKDIRIIG